jgi:lysophospholipase L1-like esterase
MLRGLVRANGFGYVDLFDKWQGGDYKQLMIDGLHPNKAGYDRLTKDIIDGCRELSFLS